MQITLSKNTFLAFERIFTVLSLIFYAEGFFKVILTGGSNQGDAVRYNAAPEQLTALIIYAITSALLLLRWKKVLSCLSRDRWIILLIAIAVMSAFWSDSPVLTLRRSIALVGTSLFGIYFATRYTLHEQLRLLGWSFGLAIIASYIFIIFLPNYGVSGGIHAGTWRGIWGHKNGLGQKMAIAVNIFLLLSLSVRRYRWIVLMGLAAAFLLVVMSQSTTAWVAAVVPLAVIPLAQAFRLNLRLMIPATIAIVAASAVISMGIAYGADTVLSFLGEDTTLTGRTDFWPIVIDMIRQKPLLGYGYEAFWRGLDGPSAAVVYATLGGYTPGHAHNGILQLWLHLGFVGVCVFLVGLWVTLMRSIACIRFTNSADGLWPLLVCLMLIQFNIPESVVLVYNGISWILYVSAALSVLQLPEHRPQAPSEQSSLVLT